VQLCPQEAVSIVGALTRKLAKIMDEPRGIREILEARKFNFAIVPASTFPRYLIGDTGISTPGNLTTLSAAVKSGKTSIVGALIGAALGGGDAERPIKALNINLIFGRSRSPVRSTQHAYAILTRFRNENITIGCHT
jgi:hypothetical protein